VITSVYCFGGSYMLYFIVDKLLSMRVREDQEDRGLDQSQHGEKID
jgi:Amt family ammonium transporter